MIDAMIEGLCCFWCGVVFEKAHGHPVLCKDCYKPNSKFPEATHKEEKIKEK